MTETEEKTTIRVTIPTAVLTEVNDILSETGVEVHEAVRLYLSQIIMQHGIPYNGFKSGIKPRNLKQSKKAQAREFSMEDHERELVIAKARYDIKYHSGTLPEDVT